MVYFVSPANRTEITVVCFTQKSKPLVNENIVKKEIGKTVKGYAQPYPEKKIIIISHSEKKADDSGNRKNQKEEVVVLEKAGRFFLMMVFMKRPKPSMHDEFMGEPCHAFHANKGG